MGVLAVEVGDSRVASAVLGAVVEQDDSRVVRDELGTGLGDSPSEPDAWVAKLDDFQAGRDGSVGPLVDLDGWVGSLVGSDE